MREVEERRSEIRKARIIVLVALALAALCVGVLIGTTDFAKGNIIEIGAVMMTTIVVLVIALVVGKMQGSSRS